MLAIAIWLNRIVQNGRIALVRFWLHRKSFDVSARGWDDLPPGVVVGVVGIVAVVAVVCVVGKRSVWVWQDWGSVVWQSWCIRFVHWGCNDWGSDNGLVDWSYDWSDDGTSAVNNAWWVSWNTSWDAANDWTNMSGCKWKEKSHFSKLNEKNAMFLGGKAAKKVIENDSHLIGPKVVLAERSWLQLELQSMVRCGAGLVWQRPKRKGQTKQSANETTTNKIRINKSWQQIIANCVHSEIKTICTKFNKSTKYSCSIALDRRKRPHKNRFNIPIWTFWEV